MSGLQAEGPPAPVSLSICIPTYNRAECLDQCLRSLESATRGLRDRLQIIVSDNASTDSTPEIARKWASVLPILYIRNPKNIGGERNFFSAARLALAEYVWVFGDDDQFGEFSVSRILEFVDGKYDVVIANYSSWSKDMSNLITEEAMSRRNKTEFNDPDAILANFGILMGYISSIIVKKRILLSVPPSEYEVFVPYGFPFPFCVYAGLPRPSRLAFIPEPLFKRREHNSDLLVQSHSTWIKYFIEGPALVFEALRGKGYSIKTVRRAKTRNLRDFGIKNVASGFNRIDRQATLSMMFCHYKASWRFWAVWLPFLLLPAGIVNLAMGIRSRLRDKTLRNIGASDSNIR